MQKFTISGGVCKETIFLLTGLIFFYTINRYTVLLVSMAFFNRNKLFLGLFALVAISIPLTLSLLNKNQETRSRATASTTLALTPESSTSAPIQANVGDTVSLDMMVNPGTNLVTFIKYQISYDATKLTPVSADPFTVNTTSFPTKVEGPILSTGQIAQSISVGSDPTKAIQTTTKVGTLNFKAIASTSGTPTVVSFTSVTQALSAGSGDQAAENVISTTIPANIAITGDGSASAGTILSFDLLLHGIGKAGDNPNPTGNSLSNKNPLHPDRNLDVEIYNTSNQLVSSKSGTITYASSSGTFKGTVDLGASFVTGDYNIKIKTDRYLKRLIPGVQHITQLQNAVVPQASLVAGDTAGDNVLNVLDYNAFLDCGYGALTELPISDPAAPYNTSACQVHTPAINIDVDDNGTINSPDYNLFLRELSVQNGD